MNGSQSTVWVVQLPAPTHEVHLVPTRSQELAIRSIRSEYGTCNTVKTRFRPLLSGESL